jgi:hypothetical protein
MQAYDAGPGEAVELSAGGHRVAQYVWRPEVPGEVAPRPYLHPVWTYAGTAVTGLMPSDHLHHLGAGVAIPNVNGENFWGGRTFVRDHGPTELDNHGTQHHVGWVRRSADHLCQQLEWIARSGSVLMCERRAIAARPHESGCWRLTFSFRLTNATQAPLVVRSPALSGRAGAGYGGLFWRAPGIRGEVTAFSAAGVGAGLTHGTTAAWVALTGRGERDAAWTLVFAGADARTGEDPWFVRTDDYPAVGSSLAWAEPLLLEPGDEVFRSFHVVVADGVLSPARAAEVVADIRADDVVDGEWRGEPGRQLLEQP